MNEDLQTAQRETANRYALSVWSCEVCVLRMGTAMEVSLTAFSCQRWVAAPPDSNRSWGLLCTVSTSKTDDGWKKETQARMTHDQLSLTRKEQRSTEMSYNTQVCGLTQESWESIAQGEALVAADTKGRQQVEPLVQERLKAWGWGVGWMKQVVDLLTGWT